MPRPLRWMPDEYRQYPCQSIAGGDIAEACRVETGEGPVFIKGLDEPPPGIFEAEAAGLALLRQFVPGAVPDVIGVGAQWIALTWIEAGQATPAALGRLLAQLHGATPAGALFGAEVSNFIGTMTQQNGPCSSWDEFWITCRIEPQVRAARDAGLYDRSQASRVLEGAARLAGEMPAEPPCVVHGDLWAGNVMASDGAWLLIDPAAHLGHREVDVAFARWGGISGAGVWAAYEAELPLADGFRQREPGLLAYHLLVHANLFGGGYIRSAYESATHLL